MRLKNGPPTVVVLNSGLSKRNRPNTMPAKVSAATISAPTSCTTLLAAQAQALEPDGHGEPDADLQRGFGQSRADGA